MKGAWLVDPFVRHFVLFFSSVMRVWVQMMAYLSALQNSFWITEEHCMVYLLQCRPVLT